jgi:hypothetical protein
MGHSGVSIPIIRKNAITQDNNIPADMTVLILTLSCLAAKEIINTNTAVNISANFVITMA